MIRSGTRTLAAFCLLAATPAFSDCLPAGAGMPMKSPGQTSLRVALTTNPAKIKVGEPFSVDIGLCGEDSGIDRLAIDATMPAHRHGMNYTPSVVAKGQGHYQANGMLFHMPGRWEVVVTVFGGATPRRLTLDMDIR